MNYINDKEFDISNIKTWHNKGYTGKNIKIANLEPCYTSAWYFEKDIKDPFNIGRNTGENNHGDHTINVISQVAPNADLYILPDEGSYDMNSANGNFIEKTIPFLESEEIQLVNASLSGVDNEVLRDRIILAQEQNVTFITSAGNEDERGASGYARSGSWITVGGVLLDNKGNTVLEPTSSRDDCLTCVQYTGIYVNDIREHRKKEKRYVRGTSFSSPMVCGMLALVQEFFLEKTGQTLNQKTLCKFILDNSIDLGTPGKDIEYGHGLFVLPNPDDIDINRYVKGESMEKFKDVNETDWFYEAVKYATENDIMKGYKDGTFRPDQPLTRAEIAQIEYNRHLRRK